MSFDEFGAYQRYEQKKQLQAMHSGKIVLKAKSDKFSMLSLIIGFILFIPTFSISMFLSVIATYFHTKKSGVYVENIATGERFYLSKEDWKKYRKKSKENNSKTKSFDDLQ